MHIFVEKLEQAGFNLKYISSAIDLLNSRCESWLRPQYIESIADIIYLPPNTINQHTESLTFFQLRYFYFYLIQNILTENKHSGFSLLNDTGLLIQTSINQSKIFCEKNRLSIAETVVDPESVNYTNGNSMKQRAYNIFCKYISTENLNSAEARKLVMDDFKHILQLTDSAATYFYTCKKQFKATGEDETC